MSSASIKAVVQSDIRAKTTTNKISKDDHADLLDLIIDAAFRESSHTGIVDPPASGLGEDGDIAFTTNKKLYKKVAGTWGLALDLSLTNAEALDFTFEESSSTTIPSSTPTDRTIHARYSAGYLQFFEYTNAWAKVLELNPERTLYQAIVPSNSIGEDGWKAEMTSGVLDSMMFQRQSGVWTYIKQSSIPSYSAVLSPSDQAAIAAVLPNTNDTFQYDVYLGNDAGRYVITKTASSYTHVGPYMQAAGSVTAQQWVDQAFETTGSTTLDASASKFHLYNRADGETDLTYDNLPSEAGTWTLWLRDATAVSGSNLVVGHDNVYPRSGDDQYPTIFTFQLRAGQMIRVASRISDGPVTWP